MSPTLEPEVECGLADTRPIGRTEGELRQTAAAPWHPSQGTWPGRPYALTSTRRASCSPSTTSSGAGRASR
jgi:hypothetical protein